MDCWCGDWDEKLKREKTRESNLDKMGRRLDVVFVVDFYSSC